jgi:hypothetical protein
MDTYTLPEGVSVTFYIRRSRKAKRTRLQMNPEGQVLVTLPLYATRESAVAAMRERAPWISRQLTRLQSLTVFAYDTWDEYYARKSDAYELAMHLIAQYAPLLGLSIPVVRIRNTKSRWGSCSGNGHIMLNYRIVKLPESVAAYLVVHELCHLTYAGHSSQFWQCVASCMPDYREHHATLQQYVIR